MIIENKYNVLITYDIEKKHTEVRNSLIQDYGFEEVIVSDNNVKCYLPNTTLYKKNTTKKSALSTLQDVCKTLGANLKRGISMECSNWQALVGEEL